MSETCLKIEQPRPGVTVLALNRPERRNALSRALMDGLCHTLPMLAADPAQRVVIVRGNGPVFCAGLDLKEASDPQTADGSAELVLRTLQALSETPLVTIAAAHGAAYAGGGGLMAACDIVVAADTLRIAFPEVRRGLLPALVSVILRRKLRDGDLRELLLLGEPIDAPRALAWGLVQRVVPESELFSEALRIAATLLEGAPQAVRDTKRLLAELHVTPEAERFDRALAFHHHARAGDEAKEGMAAFLEKRRPDWCDT